MSLPNTAHWQPALEGEGFVEDLEDILQCVHTILKTPKGSQPLRPDFGSDVHLYVDWPVNQARPHIVRESVEAIRQWEKRVDIKRVDVSLEGDSNMVIKPFLTLSNGVVISTEVRP
jgi:uncharacterized protein